MRKSIVLLAMLLGSFAPAQAQIGIGIGLPNVSIGINLPVYPHFVQVPSYPVYYAPQVGLNLFFYDGLYWVYQDDNWYASSWYNGPWSIVGPQYVPVYVLRVPVRYYRRPPPYFRGWPQDAPPRWGQHYGKHWENERHDWDDWNHRSAPPPAPLPVYQRQYSGDRYPGVQQQPVIRNENYRYQPTDPVARQHYERESAYAMQQQGPPQQNPGKGPDEGKAHGQGKGHDQGKGHGQGHDDDSPH